jgi:diaminopimelate epimerase
MTNIPFFKYQGAGNDFIIIDNRLQTWLTKSDEERIRHLCDRRFGIGADGLILLQTKPDYDFEMVYFNSDGRESSMCGNGGRCIVALAKHLNIIAGQCRFLAIDGEHEALIPSDNWVELKMKNVSGIESGEGYYVLDTGSPHYVIFVEDLDDIDVVDNGKTIRYSDRFRKEGINVNFVQVVDEGLEVATYERGVEDETLSCGTGVTASALAWCLQTPGVPQREVPVSTKGGQLAVRSYQGEMGNFQDVWLCGPAVLVFTGVYLD